MAETPLVEKDIEQGRKFLELLDRAGISVKGAVWIYQADNERWRLFIFTDEARHGSKDLLLKAIDAGADIDLSSVQFDTTENPLFKGLKQFVRVEGVSQVRMQKNIFGGVYVEDAVIYRLAA
jgi:hypothetical protein